MFFILLYLNVFHPNNSYCTYENLIGSFHNLMKKTWIAKKYIYTQKLAMLSILKKVNTFWKYLVFAIK